MVETLAPYARPAERSGGVIFLMNRRQRIAGPSRGNLWPEPIKAAAELLNISPYHLYKSIWWLNSCQEPKYIWKQKIQGWEGFPSEWGVLTEQKHPINPHIYAFIHTVDMQSYHLIKRKTKVVNLPFSSKLFSISYVCSRNHHNTHLKRKKGKRYIQLWNWGLRNDS